MVESGPFYEPGVPGVLDIFGLRYPFELRSPGVMLISFLMVNNGLMFRVRVYHEHGRHKDM